MWINTVNGWRRIHCASAIPPLPAPKAHSLAGYREAGYKSFIGWIHKDTMMEDPNQGF